MSHKKRMGITVIACIFICLIGLWGSIAGSLRFGMRNNALEHLAKEWELSQMQITKIASYMSMADFLVIMAENPEIKVEGTAKLLDAEYTRNFVSEKLKDYRDDFLYGKGTGSISFSELVELYEVNKADVDQDLQYCLNTSDLQKYETIWDNLAVTERSSLEYYRFDHPALFAIARVVLSGWFLVVLILLILGACAGVWYMYCRSFRGYGSLGVSLAIVGIIDCSLAALRDSMVNTINRIVDMRSNLMMLIFTPIRNSLFVIGAVFILFGVVAIVLRVYSREK